MMFVVFSLLFGSSVAFNSERKLQDWVPRRTVKDGGGLCLYEPDCYNYWGGCEAGTFCNITRLVGGQIHSICLENPGFGGEDYNCLSIRNSNGANNRIGCVSDGDCCNPSAKCGLDRYCHLPCDLPDPPTSMPTAPSEIPTSIPTSPTEVPTESPTKVPSAKPTMPPTVIATTDAPSAEEGSTEDPPEATTPAQSPYNSPNASPNFSPSGDLTEPAVPLPHFQHSRLILFRNTDSLELSYNEAVAFSRSLSTALNFPVGTVGARQEGPGLVNNEGEKTYDVLVIFRVPNVDVPEGYRNDYEGLKEIVDNHLDSPESLKETTDTYNKNREDSGLKKEASLVLEALKVASETPTFAPSLASLADASGSSDENSNGGAIAGGIIGALAGLALITFGVYYYYSQLGAEEAAEEKGDAAVNSQPTPGSNPTSFDNVDILVSETAEPISQAPSMTASP